MPLKEGFDKEKNKYYVKFGSGGSKYYYKEDSERSHQIAINKALKQAAAIHISQNKNIKKQDKK